MPSGGDISSLSRQVLRADWLHGGCHLAASRCITSTAVITVPGALTEDEHTTETTNSWLLLKSGGSKPPPSIPSCRGSCTATAFGFLKPIPRHRGQRAPGFSLEGSFAALTTGSLQQRSDACQPSPHHVTPKSASTGALEGAAPRRRESHPLQQLGAPARLCRLSRVQGASSSLLPRVTSDQWHL